MLSLLWRNFSTLHQYSSSNELNLEVGRNLDGVLCFKAHGAMMCATSVPRLRGAYKIHAVFLTQIAGNFSIVFVKCSPVRQ